MHFNVGKSGLTKRNLTGCFLFQFILLLLGNMHHFCRYVRDWFGVKEEPMSDDEEETPNEWTNHTV